MTIPWADGLVLSCPSCRSRLDPGPEWSGCPRCSGPLETIYDDADATRLPVARELLTDLGATPTPLLGYDTHTWLKLEYRNPTGSHKDRFHAVASAIARLGRARGVVTTSTGNHGVSCAAHAAADGIPCVVLSTRQLPYALERQLIATGAVIGQLAAGERREFLRELVDDGWFPSTTTDPALSGAANPYGVDGYRSIATEVVAALGGFPDAVFVPTGSGDTFLGVSRGFHDLARRADEQPPVVVAAQPEAAATISASLAQGHQVAVEAPHSVARSTADPMSGRLAIAAARAEGALAVPEERIIESTLALAARGHYVETSSALALAGLEIARETGLVADDAVAVAVLTASGRGWNEDVPELLGSRRVAVGRDGVLAALAARRA